MVRRFWLAVLPLLVVLGLTACNAPAQKVTSKAAVAAAIQKAAPTAAVAAATGHPCSQSNYFMQCATAAVGQAGAKGIDKTFHLSGDTTAVFGADFAWGGPSPSAMNAAGARFGASYFSYDGSKNWTSWLVSAYHAAGVATVGVWESGANVALNGYSAGRSDAFAALSQARALGWPDSRPIYFAVDFDTTGYGCAICGYFDGVNSVIGKARTGAYGGLETMRTLFNSGRITYGWQTLAWSYGVWDGRAQLRQTSIDNWLGGKSVDFDWAVAHDYGQWPYAKPGPSPAEIAGWIRGRNYSVAAFEARHCAAGNLARLTRADCVTFRERTEFFQGLLNKVQPRPHCFAGWNGKSAVCKVIRPELARRSAEIYRIRQLLVYYGCRKITFVGSPPTGPYPVESRGPNHDKYFCKPLFAIGDADHAYINANLY